MSRDVTCNHVIYRPSRTHATLTRNFTEIFKIARRKKIVKCKRLKDFSEDFKQAVKSCGPLGSGCRWYFCGFMTDHAQDPVANLAI